MAREEKTMGTKVIILHGWSYSTEKWAGFVNLLKAKNINTALLDIPGLTQNTDKVWGLEDYVKWLAKNIGEEKVILMGHSNGGRIALAFAAKYPSKLSMLILIDSAGIYHNELPLRLKRFAFKTLAKVGKKLTTAQALKNLLYKLARESDYKNASPSTRQTLVNLISIDLTSLLNKITVPTLIIWGKGDKMTPLSDGKLMRKLIENSKLVVVNGAKHSPQFTHTEQVANIVQSEIK